MLHSPTGASLKLRLVREPTRASRKLARFKLAITPLVPMFSPCKIQNIIAVLA
jgi:hypothetical protein